MGANFVPLQLERLRKSGLANQTKTLFISCIYRQEEDLTKLRTMLEGIHYEIAASTTNAHQFEYPALDIVYKKAQEENCLIYYFHTKGVSYHGPQQKDRHWLYFKKKVEAWREVMEYFNIDKWQVAANVLSDGYDTYYCLRYPPKPAIFSMYSGNFWWISAPLIFAHFNPSVLKSGKTACWQRHGSLRASTMTSALLIASLCFIVPISHQGSMKKG